MDRTTGPQGTDLTTLRIPFELPGVEPLRHGVRRSSWQPDVGHHVEVELQRGGGRNAGSVVRDGDRLLRPTSANSDVVRRLLDRLHDVGFAGAPAHLGQEADGREVLSWVEGATFPTNVPTWLRAPATLADVGRLLRLFHNAVKSWSDVTWEPMCAPPDLLAGTIVCHGDLGFGNVVFRERRPIAFIDFEFIVRADPLYDVATLASVWPVLPETAPGDATGRRDFEECLLAVAEGYGLDRGQRLRLPKAMAAVEQNAITFMTHLLDIGDTVAIVGDFATVLPERAVRLGWLRSAVPHLESAMSRS